jgi:uncharacterized NAD-dependent epimerase/dehydratase family protein
MRQQARRRLVILTEGNFGPHAGKTAFGVIRYGHDEIVAVLDSTLAGRNVAEWIPGHDIPIVGTLEEALEMPGRPRPDTLLVGIAPTGGRLPDSWHLVLHAAIDAGLELHSGLHTFLGDDPELSSAAAIAGVRIVDYRRPPERYECAIGRRHLPGRRVILTVGTDCAIGKMSVAFELRNAGRAVGDRVSLVPTGQTGMMIEGWGVAVDRVISDFLNGTVEWLVEEGERLGDWVIVEGQGSLDHPAYSAVTLGLIHGATPHAMVLVHRPGQTRKDFDHLPDRSFPIADLPDFIDLHDKIASAVAPSRVVAVAVNTSLYADDGEARQVIEAIAAETGLPADDPVRFGGSCLWSEVKRQVDALPWLKGPVEQAGAAR